jgi:putative restriction endonuclease
MYRACVIGEADQAIRLAVFDWLAEQRELQGESLSRSSLQSFSLGGRSIPLVGPSGIWKPAACELPISITTSYMSPYTDSWTGREGEVQYSYRGTDPQHRDNVGLRRAMRERVPLVYFLAIEPGIYAAAFPTFVVADDPGRLHFTLQVDDAAASLHARTDANDYLDADAEPRRAYVTAVVQRRLHQVAFRERVIRAYEERCALCRLRHRSLLDAAHITPDREDAGEPVVTNGMALCKLHHAAFDQFFFAVTPDYKVEVRPSILAESDGPMLVVGLQQIQGQQIYLPKRAANQPDRDRLERRYEEFRRVAVA